MNILVWSCNCSGFIKNCTKKVCSRLFLSTFSPTYILCNKLAVKIDYYTCFQILLFAYNISDIKMQLHEIVILQQCWCGLMQCTIAPPPCNISLLLRNNQTHNALVVSAMVCVHQQNLDTNVFYSEIDHFRFLWLSKYKYTIDFVKCVKSEEI